MGAWIETSQRPQGTSKPLVAPLVGAWIETLTFYYSYSQELVAPLVGAWIETYQKKIQQLFYKSHPSWVRGLKL